MENRIRMLRIIYYAFFAQVVLFLCIFSYLKGSFQGLDPYAGAGYFIMETTAILITLAAIYFAAKALTLSSVRKYIARYPLQNFSTVQTARYAVTAGACLANAVLYFLFGTVSNFYLALICVLAFIFLYPSRDLCKKFMEEDENNREEA